MKTTKAAFVLTFPPGTPAQEIIESGERRGIKLDDNYIYVVRSRSEHVLKKKTQKRVTAKDADLAEAQLRVWIAAVGLTRSRLILDAMDAEFR